MPNENDQRMIDNGFINDNGDLIAFDKAQSELRGVCDCFLTEGTRNCDQECLGCNEDIYGERLPESGYFITTSEHKIFDLTNTENLHSIIFNPTVGFFEERTGRGTSRSRIMCHEDANKLKEVIVENIYIFLNYILLPSFMFQNRDFHK